MSACLEKLKGIITKNLDLSDINDSKKFWTTVKLVFCNKLRSVENIALNENGKLVRDEKEVANIFNDFFVNIVPNLGINTEHDFLNTTNISHNPSENAVYKYENHPSVIAIKKYMKGTNSSFSFQTVTKENIAKLITNLHIKKAVQSVDIPTKLVKEFGCWFLSFIASNINKCINEGTYVDAFKKAKSRPVYKKDGKTEKSDYRPISFLSNVSKFMKDACMIRFILILIKYFQGISANFVKVLAHSISF